MSDKNPQAVKAESTATRLLFTTMTQKQQADKAQLFFDASVLNKYREDTGYRIIRTDTTGRVSKQGVWSVDFGISGEAEELIHISAEAWVYKIPKVEQEHWLLHMWTLPMSQHYLRALVRPGCMDDGPIRNW